MSADGSQGNSVGGHRPPLQRIVLGSRGSELARRQTAMVAAALQQVWPELEIKIEIITTRGDEKKGSASFQPDWRTGSSCGELAPWEETQAGSSRYPGRKGLFTGEIERVLADGKIDIAVHSAKDLPSETTNGVEVGGVLPRAAVDDLLISKRSDGTALRPGATIATGSVRRQHQLRWKHPGIEVADLRGNVPTRLRKLVSGGWDAIVLARAGLERLGYDLTGGSFDFEGTILRAEVLSSDDFLPAGGQGVIAMQVRSDDENAKTLVRAIDDPETSWCLQAEREFLRLLQGDCGSPVGVLATISGSAMTVRAQVFEPPRIEPRSARVEGEPTSSKELARELWETING